MIDRSVGFVGAGRVARIMTGGWTRSQAVPRAVLAYDQSAAALDGLQQAFPSVTIASLAEASAADVVFGALHPPALTEVLPEIAANLQPDAIFCSLAPKLRLPALITGLGGFQNVARMNPNAPSIVNAGFNPIAFADTMSEAARDRLRELVAPLGTSPEVADGSIETYAVISAMGPTYFWFQFEEVQRLALTFGLSPEAARHAVTAMLGGAIATMFESDLPAAEVMDLVPVRPLADDECAIREVLQARLGAVHQRLTQP